MFKNNLFYESIGFMSEVQRWNMNKGNKLIISFCTKQTFELAIESSCYKSINVCRIIYDEYLLFPKTPMNAIEGTSTWTIETEPLEIKG